MSEKAMRRKLKGELTRLKNAVNKYEIQYIGSDLGMYSGKHLRLVYSDLLEMLKTASIRHTLSVLANIIPKVGKPSQTAIPILLDKMNTSDQWLQSGYAYAVREIAWIFKQDIDTLGEIISEIQAVIDEDIEKTDSADEMLTAIADELDNRPIQTTINTFTGDDVRLYQDNRKQAKPHLMGNLLHYGESHLSDETLVLIRHVYEMPNRVSRHKRLQAELDELERHRKTGWQNDREISGVLMDFVSQENTIHKVYVFGSRHTKTYRSSSDLDLAVQLHDTGTPRETYQKHMDEWYQWLSEQLPYEIDLFLYISDEETPEIFEGASSRYSIGG